MDAREFLEKSRQTSLQRFQENQRIASFDEYLARVAEEPYLHTRGSARYVTDMLDFYGTRTVTHGGGEAVRWVLFDDPFQDAERELVGLEEVQAALYRAFQAFASEGRPTRILFLHGPNGSGKTTAVNLLFQGLQHYSREPQGALHRFSWVFPTKEIVGERMGFDGGKGFAKGKQGKPPSYAYLEGEDVQAVIPCELHDHPLFLLPRGERWEFVMDALRRKLGGVPEPGPLRRVLDGELCHKCREIFETLLTDNRGDLAEVLRHVRVERFFVSKRYRRGAVRVNPQFHVDAGEVQVSVDRSLSSLPASLQYLSLWVPVGDLVDANVGIVEFADILKRPIEANTYLLDAIETGQVNLPHSTAYLDVLMLASSNEKHLFEFKKTALWTSFKARTELIPVPYLLRYSVEQRIYGEEEEVIRRRKHLAPRTVELASLWAVLTRIRKPDPDAYPAEVRSLVRELTPMQKALLYDHGEAPPALTSADRRRLEGMAGALLSEFQDGGAYEGSFGASPREVKTVLLYCLTDGARECVTPMDLFDQLQVLVRDKTVYEFLRIEPEGGFHDADRFVEEVRLRYLRLLEEEIRDSVGLVEEAEYEKLFARYVLHMKAHVSAERLRNPQSGEYEEPDRNLIQEVEEVVAAGEDVAAFRSGLISRIGAWRVDQPKGEVDYAELFPDLMRRLEEDFYKKRRQLVEEAAGGLLKHGTDEFALLAPELRRRVEKTLRRMKEVHGYCDHCVKEAVSFFLRGQ